VLRHDPYGFVSEKDEMLAIKDREMYLYCNASVKYHPTKYPAACPGHFIVRMDMGGLN
jgi:hypothetical protein